jgi:hypothetical protein
MVARNETILFKGDCNDPLIAIPSLATQTEPELPVTQATADWCRVVALMLKTLGARLYAGSEFTAREKNNSGTTEWGHPIIALSLKPALTHPHLNDVFWKAE